MAKQGRELDPLKITQFKGTHTAKFFKVVFHALWYELNSAFLAESSQGGQSTENVYQVWGRKIDQKLTFLFRNHQDFGLLGKITSQGELSQKFSMSNYA